MIWDVEVFVAGDAAPWVSVVRGTRAMAVAVVDDGDMVPRRDTGLDEVMEVVVTVTMAVPVGRGAMGLP